MDAITETFGLLIDVWKEMWEAFKEFFPKFLSVCFWALCGVIILPCVYIANHFFPKWVKWGEDF